MALDHRRVKQIGDLDWGEAEALLLEHVDAILWGSAQPGYRREQIGLLLNRLNDLAHVQTP